MSDDAIRRALARLARSRNPEPGPDTDLPPMGERPTFTETIERATTAVDDVERAAEFVDEVGLDELERAVERAEQSVSGCASDGRRALETYREFSAAADGVRANDASAGWGEHRSPGDHFHPGRGTSLGGDDVARSK